MTVLMEWNARDRTKCNDKIRDGNKPWVTWSAQIPALADIWKVEFTGACNFISGHTGSRSMEVEIVTKRQESVYPRYTFYSKIFLLDYS